MPGTQIRVTLKMMSEPDEVGVPDEIAQAALRTAERLGKDVADVPLVAIAQEAGISRSTLLRRLGGTRGPLDDAVRARGVDPGGRPPVRERAVVAAARLIGEHGLAAATLESVAAAAGCSVHSLYAAFGGRDGLLGAVFERHSPFPDLDRILERGDDLETTVHALYRASLQALGREPRILPALLADVFARPQGPTAHTLRRLVVPRVLAGLGDWLRKQIAAGRIRDLPLPLVVQQLLGPVALHVLMRPVLESVPEVDLPSTEDSCAVLADNFLRAVAVRARPEAGDGRTHGSPHE